MNMNKLILILKIKSQNLEAKSQLLNLNNNFK